MAAECDLQLPPHQEPLPRRQNRGSPLRDQLVRASQAEERLREVHGPPDVANGASEFADEVLHGY